MVRIIFHFVRRKSAKLTYGRGLEHRIFLGLFPLMCALECTRKVERREGASLFEETETAFGPEG